MSEKLVELNLVLEQYKVFKCPDCNKIHHPTEVIPGVQCRVCGEYHATDSGTFIAVCGNVTLGLNTGLIGNNIDKDGVVKKTSVFCPECFLTVCKLGKKESKNSIALCPAGKDIIKDFPTCSYRISCKDMHKKIHTYCKEGYENEKNN